MTRAIGSLLAVFVLVATPVRAERIIVWPNDGTTPQWNNGIPKPISLKPNTAGQTLTVWITPDSGLASDAQSVIGGMEMNVETSPTATTAPGIPPITNVDLAGSGATATIWNGVTDPNFPVEDKPTNWFRHESIMTSGFGVTPTSNWGILAVVSVDTTGITAGQVPFLVKNTQSGTTMWGDTGLSRSDGNPVDFSNPNDPSDVSWGIQNAILKVPEPTSIVMLLGMLIPLAAMGRWYRRRVK